MQEADATAEVRPRLVVAYGHRSLDAMQIREAARGWCDLIWLIDGEDSSAAAVRPLLARFGLVIDALRAPSAQAAEQLRVHSPDGLATFYDTGMEHIAEIASELGVPFHSPETARALEDKLYQREALRSAGLPTPRAAALPATADRATVERLGAGVDYPAVLKPRCASGSWHTFVVESAGELGQRWDELAAAGREEMLVEEFLPDGPPMPAGFEADYVSVETVLVAGRMTHLAITGRFPLEPPLRETGFFIPATLGPEQRAEMLKLAGETLGALGMETGCAHTEIKLTSEGPRVIEVNGRIGGGVPEMLRLATGVDIMRAAMRAALGLPVDAADLPPASGVAYRFFLQPPATARRLTAITGLERLQAVPGVESVWLHHPPGTGLDARDGTRTYLLAVVGLAADYAGVQEIERLMKSIVTATYEHG